MASEPPPLPRDPSSRVWSRIPWLYSLGALGVALDLGWCWVCVTDKEGPGGGMAMVLWLVIEAALILGSTLFLGLGLYLTRERPRWLGYLLLIAAWVPSYWVAPLVVWHFGSHS